MSPKVREGFEIDEFDFMPHEDAPETSFEEERMKAFQKKESA